MFFLPVPLDQTSTGKQYFVDGRSTVAVSQLTSPWQYYMPYHHHHRYHHHQQQRHWDATVSVWNAQSAASRRCRKLFSVDAILNHSDTWRTDDESISRLETSDLSGELRQLLLFLPTGTNSYISFNNIFVA